MKLLALLTQPKLDCALLAQELDATGHAERLQALAHMPRASLARLYDAVSGFRPLHISDMVPEKLPAYTSVVHAGINNLPLARNFSKVLYREANGTLAGRNVQSLAWLTGHGYFTMTQSEKVAGEITIDYARLPATKPNGWPEIISNARGISFFVYRDLIDTMRGVSAHVTIGRASRHGQDLPNYFMLVREQRVQQLPIVHPDRRTAAA